MVYSSASRPRMTSACQLNGPPGGGFIPYRLGCPLLLCRPCKGRLCFSGKGRFDHWAFHPGHYQIPKAFLAHFALRRLIDGQPDHPSHKADVEGVSGQPADARCARCYLTVNRFGLLFQFGNIPALLREKTEGGGRDDVPHEPLAIGIFHNVPPVPHSAASAIYR